MAMTEAGLRRLAEQINGHLNAVEFLVNRIRESGHPLAEKVADALLDNCVVLADPVSVVESALEGEEGA
jgi:hypothetical protein